PAALDLALSLARGGACLLRGRLLSRGLLGYRLLSGCLLSWSRPGGGPPGPAVRPLGGRGLVEAQLLLRVRSDPGRRRGADTGRGTVSNSGADAGLGTCVWVHSVLLPQAGRVSSRGRDALVRTLVSGTCLLLRRPALAGFDRLNELPLAHPARPLDAKRLRHA